MILSCQQFFFLYFLLLVYILERKKREKIDKVYRERYNMSTIKNLKYIKKYGTDKFLKDQKEKYRCPECGGVICVHNGICYSCGKHITMIQK